MTVNMKYYLLMRSFLGTKDAEREVTEEQSTGTLTFTSTDLPLHIERTDRSTDIPETTPYARARYTVYTL